MVRVLTDHIAQRRFPRIVQVFFKGSPPWLCDVVHGDTNQGCGDVVRGDTNQGLCLCSWFVQTQALAL